MKLEKKFIIALIVLLAIVLIPGIANAAYVDTFTTDDGIVAKKLVQSTNGDIEIKFSNIELDSEGRYTWGIGRTSNAEEIEYSANLGDFSQENKTALVSLTTSQDELWLILRETNTAYLFIKNETTGEYVVNALRVDLTLPALKAFKVTDVRKKEMNYDMAFVLTKNGECNSHSSNDKNNGTKSTYDIENMYFKFIKITDEEVISAYQDAKVNGVDLETLTCFADISEAPDSGWTTATKACGYYNTKIMMSDIPTEQGTYYLWLKGKDADSKTVYGYTIVQIDADGPEVKEIRVVSPEEGTYKTPQTVKIRVFFDEAITGTTVPTLKIRFGESAERTVSNGTISGDSIVYSYNIVNTDKGQLAVTGFSGGNNGNNSTNTKNKIWG